MSGYRVGQFSQVLDKLYSKMQLFETFFNCAVLYIQNLTHSVIYTHSSWHTHTHCKEWQHFLMTYFVLTVWIVGWAVVWWWLPTGSEKKKVMVYNSTEVRSEKTVTQKFWVTECMINAFSYPEFHDAFGHLRSAVVQTWQTIRQLVGSN